MKKLRERLTRFFFPPPGSPRWMLIFPYAVLGILTLLVIAGGVYGWEYTNSSEFCGTACHTMPPQDTAYKLSPHANVTCEECHIGRASFVNQLTRKSQGLKETYYQVFKLYEFPIRAKALRPARDTCEKCHQPETFSDDSLRVISTFEDDLHNTESSIYLILKTGGGAKRAGLGRGIHWHIVNKVEYYPVSELDQEIPYVRVYNDDGTTTEYVDIESDFDAANIDESKLVAMDCLTCHNRITHEFSFPGESVDIAMARGQIDPEIPVIRKRAVDALSVEYASREEAFAVFDEIEAYYKTTDYYPGHGEQIHAAVETMKDIYDRTVFHAQEINWKTYPNNLGHINSPGCFRCHDGKHLNNQQEAVRLECNVCHSIPVVAGPDDFVTQIEISRGPEPESHLNPNWISLHNEAFGPSCSACHTMEDPGGTSNTSFCSNSACHGNVYTFAGFDAPKLREILKEQLPPPEPMAELPTLDGAPTFENYVGPLFAATCTSCHGDLATGGLNMLTYTDLMKGSSNGPVVVPGNSADSVLFQVQSAGGHFANLSAEDLQMVQQWIESGAPEK
ncbi:MAG TPA: NapC/NirT family cytochrome c [Anaerolineales bacterium]|nr:NapC/NirT family cytochrome c [Anaerolineales bacterium]